MNAQASENSRPLRLPWRGPALAAFLRGGCGHRLECECRQSSTRRVHRAGDDPLHESRLYAMMHVAIHDALNAIDRRFRPYAFDVQGRRWRVSGDAAVASAARNVLVPLISQLPFPPACVQAGIASVEADYAAALAAIPNGVGQDARHSGRAGFGRRHSRLAGRRWFGYAAAGFRCTRRAPNPGEFRFTPGFDFAVRAGHGGMSLRLCSTHASQFRPGPPYHVTSKKYAADFNEVKAFGGDGVTTPSTRTPDQTQIGLFWIESSPLAWNRIARTVSASRGLGSVGERAAVRLAQSGAWPMATSRPGKPSITTTSGARSRRFRRPTPTAIRTQWGIRRGRRCSPSIPSLTTTRATACKAAQRRRLETVLRNRRHRFQCMQLDAARR